MTWARSVALVALLAAAPLPAQGFSLLEGFSSGPRWDLDGALADGIQVGVDRDLAPSLAVTEPADVALLHGGIEAAFRAWETPELRFDITFEAETTLDPLSGFEIDVFTLPNQHPDMGTAFGRTHWESGRYGPLRMTNGELIDAYPIVGTNIALNIGRVGLAALAIPSPERQVAALTRLLIHEIGHAIGLGHPGQSGPNLDTDFDPDNAMRIDPRDPGRDLIHSANLAADAIMRERPCGPDLSTFLTCEPLFYTTLTFDERGGRDFLYPSVAPEPGLSIGLALGLACALRRREP